MDVHARLYIGTFAAVLPHLPEAEQIAGTDVSHIVVSRFGIDDARALRHACAERPFARSTRSFVVAFDTATQEAQNALLKTLEEPPPTSTLAIVVPHPDVLIPTVRSRLIHIELNAASAPEPAAAARAFLALSYGERLAAIADATKAKNIAWQDTLVAGLEEVAHLKAIPELMRELLMVRQYWGSSGASRKMLLEHLALAIPTGTQ